MEQGGPPPARARRAGGLDPPHRIAAVQIEIDRGKAGLKLILAADVLHLDPGLLTTERE
jgi:hypothetical protein